MSSVSISEVTSGRLAVYLLTTKDGTPFYVGLSANLPLRMMAHRQRFGPNIELRILQEVFSDESPEAAEIRWIREFHAVTNGSLINSKHCRTPGTPAPVIPGITNKPLSKPGQTVVSVRDADLDRWRLFKEKVKEEGVTVAHALSRMMDWYLRKK